MRTDGQTDMRKPIVAVRNFANEPKKRPSLDNIQASTVARTMWKKQWDSGTVPAELIIL